MALILVDRVLEYTTTSGGANLSLTGPLAGFQPFQSGTGTVANGDIVPYFVEGSGLWETGYSLVSGAMLDRGSIVASCSGNAKIVFPSNVAKTVGLSPLARDYQNVVGSLGSGFIRIASGTIGTNSIGSGGILSGNIAAGHIGRFHIANLSIANNHIVAGAVVSGHIASGNIGLDHIASGAVNSGHIASGQIGLNHIASGAVNSGHIASGQIGLNHIASGAVRSGHIASGSIGQNHINQAVVLSGHIASGQVGSTHIASGGVLSGNIASGQVGHFHVSSGAIQSGQIGTTGTPNGTLFLRDDFTWAAAGGGLTSGAVTSGYVGNNAVVSGSIASGQVGHFHLSSGAVTSGQIGLTGTPDGTKFLRDDYTWAAAGAGLTSGSVLSGHIASGQVGLNHIASGAVRSGHIASGQIDNYKIASGYTPQFTGPFISGTSFTINTQETISGLRAVSISASGNIQIAMAGNTARMPCVGVVFDNIASGIQANVYTLGVFQAGASGLVDYSGYFGKQVFVGRSGQIVTTSGSFNSGGFLSGDIWHPVGTAVNSGKACFNISQANMFTMLSG